MRKLAWVVGFILLLMIGMIVINWGKIERLSRVNSLFDAETIVHNFSNMDDVLYAHPLPATGRPHIWPENLRPLPETIKIGSDERSLASFLEETSTTALLVVHKGEIVFEDYYLGTSKDDKRISWSMAKSFLSALFGVAVEKDLIDSLDDPVTKYAPELAGSAYAGVAIRHVLHMASGAAFNEDYLDFNSDINKMGRVLALGGSMDEFAAALNIHAREPGTERQYVSIDTHVLGMVLRGATGETMHDLFQDWLWSKIGPGADAYYLTDGEDVAFVLGGLNMRTRDYALFGQLFLQGGQWNGAQIIPANWVTESTTASAPSDTSTDNTGVDYGYQWWVPRGSAGQYFAVGIYGQYIFIDPVTETVIVKNSAHREFENQGQSGQGYMLENIDMMYSLSRHFASPTETGE